MRAAVVGVTITALLATACVSPSGLTDSAVTKPRSNSPGNPISLPPLPSVQASGPFTPIYRGAVVSATNATAVSLQPELDSGEKAQGTYTFSIAPITADPKPDWRAFQHGGPKYTVGPDAGLRDGFAYQWKVETPGKKTVGPFAMSVDITAANMQDISQASPFGVGVANGFLRFAWKGHSMQSGSGDIGIGLDYSPANAGWPGAPSPGWRIVSPNSSGWDKLTVMPKGDISAHAKNNSSVNFVSRGNGYYEPVYGAKGQPAPTGAYGTLVRNEDGTYTITDPSQSVTTFSPPRDIAGQQVATVQSVSLSGQQGVQSEFDPDSGRLVTLTDSFTGRQVELKYGGRGCPSFDDFIAAPDGLLCEVKYWDGTTSAFGYVQTPVGPQLGRIIDYANAKENGALVNDFAYDDSGRMAAMRSPGVAYALTSPASHSVAGENPNAPELLTQISYDSEGRVATITNQAARVGAARSSVAYTYSTGKNKSVATPGGDTATTEYRPATLQTTSTNINGLTTTKTYDPESGNPATVKDPVGTTSYTYDAAGLLKNQSRTNGASTTYEYDGTFPSTDPGATAKPWLGLDVQYWGNKAWLGPPSTNDLGPRASFGSAVPGALSVKWSENPVPGVKEWSARLTGSITLPKPASGKEDDVYRFALNGSNSPQLWIDQVKCESDACRNGLKLLPGRHKIRIDMWATDSPAGELQLQYSRNSPNLTTVPMTMLAPDYGRTVAQTITDQLEPDGKAVKLSTRSDYAEPQLGMATKSWNTQGLAKTSFYEQGGNGLGIQPAGEQSSVQNKARLTGTSLPAGNQFGTSYWGDKEVASSGCSGQSSAQQGGAPRTVSRPNPSDGSAGANQITRWYTDSGAVAATQDQGAAKVCFHYDDAGRLITTKIDSGGITEYDYAVDGNPLVTSETTTADGVSGTQTATSTHDLLGRVVEEVDGWGTKQESTYDDHGDVVLSKATTASGQYWVTQSNSYDGSRSLVRVEIRDSRSPDKPAIAADVTFAGSSMGRPSKVTYSNGTSGKFTYSKNQFPDSFEWADSADGKWGASQTYSPTGRILSSAVTRGSESAAFAYEYDRSTRLASATLKTGFDVEAKKWEYDYDLNSNRVAQRVDSRGINYSYDRADRLTHVDGDPQLSGDVSYNEMGAVTSVGPLRLTYDSLGSLQAIDDASVGKRITYVRNSEDAVIAKTVRTGVAEVTNKFSLGGLVLDENGSARIQMVTLPGGVSVERELSPLPAAESVSASPNPPPPPTESPAPQSPQPVGPSASDSPLTSDESLASDPADSTTEASRSAVTAEPGTQSPSPQETSATDSPASTESPANPEGAASPDSPLTPPEGAPQPTTTQDGVIWSYPALSGSTMWAANGAGAPLNTSPSLFDPFGAPINDPAAPTNDARPELAWAAQAAVTTDTLSVPVNLLGARLYIPALGRFTQIDPEIGGSANSYDYVNQDPINGMDRAGTGWGWSFWVAILASVVISVASGGLMAWATPAIAATFGALGTAATLAAVMVVGGVVGAVAAAADYAASALITGSTWDWTSFAISVGIGAVMGAYGGASGLAQLGKAAGHALFTPLAREGVGSPFTKVKEWATKWFGKEGPLRSSQFSDSVESMKGAGLGGVNLVGAQMAVRGLCAATVEATFAETANSIVGNVVNLGYWSKATNRGALTVGAFIGEGFAGVCKT